MSRNKQKTPKMYNSDSTEALNDQETPFVAGWTPWLSEIQRAIHRLKRRHWLPTAVDVDDLCQDTIRRCLGRESPMDQESAVRLACHIARAISIDYLRKYRHDARQLGEAVERLHDEHLWEHEVERLLVIQELELKLSEADRIILKEYFLEQKSIEDMCGKMGISDKTFRKKVFEIVERLRGSAHYWGRNRAHHSNKTVASSNENSIKEAHASTAVDRQNEMKNLVRTWDARKRSKADNTLE